MSKKTVFFLLLLSFGASTAPAKESSPLEKSDTKSCDKMPVYASAQMRGYEEAKKALDEKAKEPSLKEKAREEISSAAKKIAGLFERDEKERTKEEPQKGDPKTDFSKGENRGHSRAGGNAEPTFNPNRKVDLTNWVQASSTYTDTDTIKTFYYSPSSANPYDRVTVVYDTNTLALKSATGYKITVLDSVPSLAGMTLTATATRADGTLAFQSYESKPNRSGAVTQVNLYYSYDALGNILYCTQVIIQPLNLKSVKLP